MWPRLPLIFLTSEALRTKLATMKSAFEGKVLVMVFLSGGKEVNDQADTCLSFTPFSKFSPRADSP
jgi:hypothetical protein